MNDELLPAGTGIALRALEPEDADLVLEVFDNLGPASRQARFLVPKHRLSPAEVQHLTAVDHRDHEAVVALTVPGGRPVGIGRFIREREDRDTAEVAVTVVDSWQGRGVGSLLLASLVERALALRVQRFEILMTSDNRRAARLMAHLPGVRGQVAASHAVAEYLVTLPTAC